MSTPESSRPEEGPSHKELLALQGVRMLMDIGLVSVMRGDRVRFLPDERGGAWIFASPDGRFAVEARPIEDDQLADESEIRMHVPKRAEWFSGTSRVRMTTKNAHPYWDQEMGGTNTSEVVTALTFEIPYGDGQTCRLVGVDGEFQDVAGEPDPRGEKVFVGDLKEQEDQRKIDIFLMEAAAEQVVVSMPDM